MTVSNLTAAMPKRQPALPELDLESINASLRNAGPLAAVRWGLGLGKRAITTTSFGFNAAAMLHLVGTVDRTVPTVWVDTGYNLRDTYVVAEQLIEQLQLNIHIYSPLVTAERRNALMGGIPAVDDEPRHTEFTRQVKLEPFARALQELHPGVWFTGIRQTETEHRQSLDIVSLDNRGIIKVAPFFYWSDQQLEAYMTQYDLPSCKHYFDPTKVREGRECGLHTAA